MTIHLHEVMKNRNFMLLWSSQFLSQVTINIINFLIIIRLFDQTGSNIATSFVWVVFALPSLLVGPFGAVSVDIVDRRKVLMVANLLQSIAILIFVFTFDRNIFNSYLVVFAYSLFNQFYVPAEAASLPRLVRRENLPEANGFFFITEQAGVVVGAGAGGILKEVFGFGNSLLVASTLIFIAFIAVSRLPSLNSTHNVQVGLEKGISQFSRGIAEGYHYIKGRRSMLIAFLLLITMYVSVTVLSVLLPVIATDLLRVKTSSASALIVIPAGIGAGMGTFLISRLLRRGTRKRKVIEMGLLSISLIVWVSTFVLPKVEGEARLFVAVVMFLLMGLAFISVFMPTQTFLQEVTDEHMYGRVFGNFWLLATASAIVPILTTATFADVLGVEFVLYVLGAVGIAGYILARKYFHRAMGYIT